MEDPLDLAARDFLAFYTDRRVIPLVGIKSDINSAITQYYGVDETIGQLIRNIPKKMRLNMLERLWFGIFLKLKKKKSLPL